MKTKLISIVAIVALALTSVGGIALARSSTHNRIKPATPETVLTVDADNVQEGDQTTPDTGSEGEATAQAGDEPAAESDAPGGHEDPPGNVDHQFEGQE